jgi:hypothetical protein
MSGLKESLRSGRAGRSIVSLPAEAVEKANLLDHFIPDFCLHQSIQKHA